MLLATNQEKTINIMTIQESINLLQSLTDKTTKKSETKIYEEFIHILQRLDKRDFSKNDIVAIEAKLDELKLESTPKYRKRYLKKRLNDFKRFLIKSFTLTTKNYYTNLYVGLGMSFGVAFGIIIGGRTDSSMGLSLGIGIGMVIGMLLGKSKDALAMSEDRVI